MEPGTILVTGAAGLIASRVCHLLLHEGHLACESQPGSLRCRVSPPAPPTFKPEKIPIVGGAFGREQRVEDRVSPPEALPTLLGLSQDSDDSACHGGRQVTAVALSVRRPAEAGLVKAALKRTHSREPGATP